MRNLYDRAFCLPVLPGFNTLWNLTSDHGDAAVQIESLLRRSICDQLKIELATTPKSMLQQIAGGERNGAVTQR